MIVSGTFLELQIGDNFTPIFLARWREKILVSTATALGVELLERAVRNVFR